MGQSNSYNTLPKAIKAYQKAVKDAVMPYEDHPIFLVDGQSIHSSNLIHGNKPIPLDDAIPLIHIALVKGDE